MQIIYLEIKIFFVYYFQINLLPDLEETVREIKSRRFLRDRWRTILHSACGLSNLVLAAINSRIGLDRGLSNPAKQQYTERQCEEGGEGNGPHFRDARRDTPSAGCRVGFRHQSDSSLKHARVRLALQERPGSWNSLVLQELGLSNRASSPPSPRLNRQPHQPPIHPFVHDCVLSPRSLPPSQNFLGTRINTDFIMRATNTQP